MKDNRNSGDSKRGRGLIQSYERVQSHLLKINRRFVAGLGGEANADNNDDDDDDDRVDDDEAKTERRKR